MDFTSGLVCVNIRHGRQEVTEAVKQQAERLQEFDHVGEVTGLGLMCGIELVAG